ncbi:MAG: hypothetical protein J6S14_20780 [Clostridia bacterium]|nr:hypothetical protein [Clostridia bacterium]
MNIKNFVVDKVRHAMGFSRTTGEMMWHLTEVQNPTLGNSAEQKNCIGADGTPIMTLFTQKSARFSAESALLDFGLAAAQYGAEMEEASADNAIVMPAIDEFVTKEGDTTITLKNIPVGETGAEVKYIYATQPGAVATRYELGTAASETEFELDAASKTITLPTGLKAGTNIIVCYEYNATAGVRILNSAKNFPRACKFVLDVLGHDICNKDIMYSAKIVFRNAQLSPNVDITLATDGNHPFELEAQQEYCSVDKGLFEILVPDGITE